MAGTRCSPEVSSLSPMLCLSVRRCTTSGCTSSDTSDTALLPQRFYTSGLGPWGSFAVILILQKRRERERALREHEAASKLAHITWALLAAARHVRAWHQGVGWPASACLTAVFTSWVAKSFSRCFKSSSGSSRAHGLNLCLRIPPIPCWLLPLAGSRCRTTASQSEKLPGLAKGKLAAEAFESLRIKASRSSVALASDGNTQQRTH